MHWLVCSHGSGSQNTDEAQMLKALMLRKTSIFGQEDWLQVPWSDRTKSIEQRLYDHGFQLAAILEKADSLENPSLENKEILAISLDLLRACNSLHQRLEELFTNSLKPFLQERSITWRSSSEQVPDPSTLSSADIGQLMVVLNLWGCQLLLGFVANALRVRSNTTIDLHPGLATDRPAIEALCDSIAGYSDQDALSNIAHALLSYLPLCLGKGADEFAASRTLFPMTCILWQFRYSKSEFLQTMTLMRSVYETRNVRVARSGYNVMGGLLKARRPSDQA